MYFSNISKLEIFQNCHFYGSIKKGDFFYFEERRRVLLQSSKLLLCPPRAVPPRRDKFKVCDF